jgi:hypothetical protein
MKKDGFEKGREEYAGIWKGPFDRSMIQHRRRFLDLYRIRELKKSYVAFNNLLPDQCCEGTLVVVDL